MPKIVIIVMIFLIVTPNKVFADSPLVPAPAPGKITINEIFPDPKGKDKGSEWVELYNNNEHDIDLLGWKLNNGGKKVSTIKNSLIIGAFRYFVLEKENLKLALKNTDGQLQLIDMNGNLMDKIDYGKAIEEKSFSKIVFQNVGETADMGKSKWSWTTPTKNQKNDEFYVLEGEIIKDLSNPPTIEIAIKDKTLTLQISDNQNILLLTTILRPKTVAQFLVNKNGIIQDFKIKNPKKFPATKNQEDWVNYYLIILIAFSVIPLQLRK